MSVDDIIIVWSEIVEIFERLIDLVVFLRIGGRKLDDCNVWINVFLVVEFWSNGLCFLDKLLDFILVVEVVLLFVEFVVFEFCWWDWNEIECFCLYKEFVLVGESLGWNKLEMINDKVDEIVDFKLLKDGIILFWIWEVVVIGVGFVVIEIFIVLGDFELK